MSTARTVDDVVARFVDAANGRALVSCDTFGGRPPRCHVEVGIREMTAVSVAAGMAAGGIRPVVLGLNTFLISRSFGQIRQDVVLNDLPVTLVGKAAGNALGVMGPSHQLPDDVRVLRSLGFPRVACPSTDAELAELLAEGERSGRPAYLRVVSLESATADDFPPPGRRDNTRACVLTCGDRRAAGDVARRLGLPPDGVVSLRDLEPVDAGYLRALRGDVVIVDDGSGGFVELIAPLLTGARSVTTWEGGTERPLRRGRTRSGERHDRPTTGGTRP